MFGVLLGLYAMLVQRVLELYEERSATRYQKDSVVPARVYPGFQLYWYGRHAKMIERVYARPTLN